MNDMGVNDTPARDLNALLNSLDMADWSARRRVVAEVAQLGAAAVEPLCALLRTRRDHEGRLAAAVDALSQVGADASADAQIITLAQDANAAVVADAAVILGRRRSRSAIPVLKQLCTHVDDNVAVAAIEALGRMGGPFAVESLVDAANSGVFFRVFPAIAALGHTGDPRAVTPLRNLLDAPQFAPEAMQALGCTGDCAAVEPLARCLSAAGRDARGAAQALCTLRARYRERMGQQAPVEQRVRQFAGRGAVASLVTALEDADEAETVALCHVLGMLGDAAAAQPLSQLLSAATAVMQAAAAALRKLGQPAEVMLTGALRDGDSTRRQALLPLLSAHTAVSDVVWCLRDEAPSVRVLACETLGRIGSTSAVPALFALLGDPDVRVVQAAVAAIEDLGSTEACTLAMGAACLPSFRVRRAALQILTAARYEPALDVFLARLADDHTQVRDAAFLGLAHLSDARARTALRLGAQHTDPGVRAVVMRALGQATYINGSAALLLLGLEDSDMWVRYYAAQALGRLKHDAATDALMAHLTDACDLVQLAVVEALSNLCTDVAFAALCTAARSTVPDICRAAVAGLGCAGRNDALPLLLAALQSTDQATRLVGLSALAHYRNDAVLAALIRCAHDADTSVLTVAVELLGAYPTVQATVALVALLSVDATRACAISMLKISTPGRSEGLMQCLAHANDEAALLLTAALAWVHRGEASEVLATVLQLDNPAARRAAVSTLASMETADAVAQLRKAAHDPDEQVAHMARAVLAW